jgi:hypothetical protein
MCDYSGKLTGKLIAWLDRELPAEEAAEVERHLAGCSECRSDAETYKLVSGEIDAYCDAAITSSGPRVAHRWVPVASAAGAVAAVVILFLAMPGAHVQPSPFHAPQAARPRAAQSVIASSPAAVVTGVPASLSSIQKTHRRLSAIPAFIRKANPAPAQNQNANLQLDEPMIQIAIPADEMFPPGAVPEGMHFVADLTIGPDGSAERLRLRPRLAGFERRTTQP